MEQLLYLSLISTPWASDIASLALRLFAGASFITHGETKLFGERRQQNRSFMAQMGLPGSLFDGIGLLEVIGGMFLILGLLTPLLSLIFALEMIGTTLLNVSKLRKPPINAKFIGGWEVDMLLFASAVALFLLGPGLFSIDYFIGF